MTQNTRTAVFDRNEQLEDFPVTALRILSREQCVEKLEAERFGRLAFSVRGQAKIFPVNYIFDGKSVVIRTGPGFKLAEAPMRDVAFEIDGASIDGSWGWSVVVEGPCFNVTGALDQASEAARSLPVHAWAPGDRNEYLRIHARRISGREFGTAPQGV